MKLITETIGVSMGVFLTVGSALVMVALFAGDLKAKNLELENRMGRSDTYIMGYTQSQEHVNAEMVKSIHALQSDVSGIKASQGLMLQIMKQEFSK